VNEKRGGKSISIDGEVLGQQEEDADPPMPNKRGNGESRKEKKGARAGLSRDE